MSVGSATVGTEGHGKCLRSLWAALLSLHLPHTSRVPQFIDPAAMPAASPVSLKDTHVPLQTWVLTEAAWVTVCL